MPQDTPHIDTQPAPVVRVPGALPPWPTMLGRGLLNRCPICGQSRLFCQWLSVKPVCPVCGTRLGEIRADDAPPYFVILITAHIVVGLLVWMEHGWSPPLWVLAATLLPLTVVLALGLLQPVKGVIVGWMLRMGFGESPQVDDE